MAGLLTHGSAPGRVKEGNAALCVTHAVPAAFDEVSGMCARTAALSMKTSLSGMHQQ